MGYYTELKGELVLKDLPDEYIKLLVEEDDSTTPTNTELAAFRKCARWSWICLREIGENTYKVYADMKNYDDECKLFWECIKPYYLNGFLHSQVEEEYNYYYDYVRDELVSDEECPFGEGEIKC